MSIIDTLEPRLRERFPNRNMRSRQPSQADIVFPAAHPEVGDLLIYDEGDEVTVIVSEFTHLHFGAEKQNQTEAELAAVITERVISFLEKLFSDRIVFWKVLGGLGGGGCRERKEVDSASTFLVRKAVWSGPIPRR